MSYTAGGKGQAPRQSDKPSWVGLPEMERTKDYVMYKTSFGYRCVPIKQVDDWLFRQNPNKQTGKKKRIDA